MKREYLKLFAVSNSPESGTDDFLLIEDKSDPQNGDKSASLIGDKSVPLLGDKSVPLGGDKSIPLLGDKYVPLIGDKHITLVGDKSAPPVENKHVLQTGDKHVSQTGDKHVSQTGDKHVSQTSDKHVSQTGDKYVSLMVDRHDPLIGDKNGDRHIPLICAKLLDQSTSPLVEPWVSKRIGQVDFLDKTQMKTMFMEYPDILGKRFRIRFNVSELDQKTVRIVTDSERISVSATALGDPSQKDRESVPTSTDGRQLYARHIAKPPDVDETRMKSYLTSDGILIIEAPMRAFVSPSALPIVSFQANAEHQRSSSSVSSAGTPGGTGGKEKIGVPVFRDEGGQRIMQLIVDMGKWFKPGDIVVEVIKEDRVLVTAKCKHKSEERWMKCKFCKEYELTEKIDKHSLRAGLQNDGRLLVSAFVKKHGGTHCGSAAVVVKSSDEVALLASSAEQ